MIDGKIGTIDRFSIGIAESLDTWNKRMEDRRQNTALFRKLRKYGLTSDQAHSAMALMGIQRKDYTPVVAWSSMKKQVGHKLPYYHGKRRF